MFALFTLTNNIDLGHSQELMKLVVMLWVKQSKTPDMGVGQYMWLSMSFLMLSIVLGFFCSFIFLHFVWVFIFSCLLIVVRSENSITLLLSHFYILFKTQSFILSFIFPERLHCYYTCFHCSYLYDYYSYSRTLCIKCWVTAFHTEIS